MRKMGKLKNFTIILDSSQPVFYPYQTISGTVVLDLKEPMEVCRVSLKLKGEGYCEWSEKDARLQHAGGECHRVTVMHSGKETILKYEQTLCRSASSEQRSFHATGRHSYAFSFPLPGHLPTSFESDTGYIRYVLKAKIDRQWKMCVKTKIPIIINDIIDTNRPEYISEATLSGERRETINCLCMNVGPVEFNADIDRSCLCPGEPVFVNVHVQNHTRKQLSSIYIKLLQTIKYIATSKCKTETKVVAELTGPKVREYDEERWTNQPFCIPALPPTIENSTIINIRYSILIGINVPKGIDLITELGITLGTVPFLKLYGQTIADDEIKKQSPERNRREIGKTPERNRNGFTSFPSPLPPFLGDNFDMPSPSYSAPIGQSEIYIGNKRDEYTHGHLKYLPLYTFAQPYENYDE